LENKLPKVGRQNQVSRHKLINTFRLRDSLQPFFNHFGGEHYLFFPSKFDKHAGEAFGSIFSTDAAITLCDQVLKIRCGQCDGDALDNRSVRLPATQKPNEFLSNCLLFVLTRFNWSFSAGLGERHQESACFFKGSLLQ